MGRWIPVLLSFVAGYVDTVGFVALYNLFTAHVTGNFVLIGATMASPQLSSSEGLAMKLLALPVFLLGVAASTLLIRVAQARGWNAARWALAVQAVLMVLFMLAGRSAEPLTDSMALPTILAGMLGVAAMSVQNAASRLVFSDLAPSTVMTGNATQAVIDLVDLLRTRDPAVASAARRRLGKFLPPLGAFTVGALVGGVGFRLVGFATLALAVAALILAAVGAAAAPED